VTTSSTIMQPLVKAWVDQFEETDRADAAILASLIRLVPGDAFRRDLTRVLEDRLRIGPNPVALYNETERKKWKGQPNRLFPETSRASKTQKGTKTVRAYGRVGPPLVPRQRQVAEEIGSEGVVANVLTQLHKRHRKSTLLNPGADIIREKRARRFVLVTDFIGSGDRVINYLNAAWRLRTVRSWWSRRSHSGLCFEVVAYAGTEAGVERVKDHASSPTVSLVTRCPTIQTVFPPGKAKQMNQLCHRYAPPGSKPLGYGEVGALLAFDHGMPNNAPSMFWKDARRWSALVPARASSTAGSPYQEPHTPEKERARIEASAKASDTGAILRPTSLETIILSALRRSPRHSEAISGRLGMNVDDVSEILDRLKGWGWINASHQLTERGRMVASRLIRQDRKSPLPQGDDTMYFPNALRAPRDV